MRLLRQLSEMIDQLPGWGQVGIAILLVAYSIVSVYGRLNVDFGARVFSNVDRTEIQTNTSHILSYTVVPVLVTLGYLVLLLGVLGPYS